MRQVDLERRGFKGWIPLLTADGSRLLPELPGVYAVVYDLNRPDSWPLESCGGWHKGRNPAVPPQRLESKWVEGTDIVYLGKSDRALKKRIAEFARFGRGENVAHWGGRLVWQLPNVDRLRIGWQALESNAATSAESALLEEFSAIYEQLPFANLRK